MTDGEEEGGRVIVVADYDPGWPTAFAEVRDAIWPFVDDIALAFEHVGSTSVPGLAAKPVIDMDIVVSDMKTASEVIERLRPLGYVHRGELGVRGRHAFFHPEHKHAHHLYVCLLGSSGLRNHLALRDHLRIHPEDRLKYDALKRGLADRYANDIQAYIEGKTAFIVGILEQSGMTQSDLSEVLGVNQTSERVRTDSQKS